MTQQEARDRRQHDDTVHAKWMDDSNGDGKEIGFEAVSYQLSRSPCRVSKVVGYVSKRPPPKQNAAVYPGGIQHDEKHQKQQFQTPE